MKVFMTNGTYEYLERLKGRHPEENVILMSNDTNALAYHETDGETIFKEGRLYEILDSAGTIVQSGFAVLNNIPVTYEGRSVFEYRIKNRSKAIEKQPGFHAYRFLCPKSNETYVILTLWEDENSYKNWKDSQAFADAHKKGTTQEGGPSSQQIFSGPSYVTQYVLPTE